MNTDRMCVLVTGVGGRSVGHQILHGLLLLGSKYRIVACDCDRFAYGLYEAPVRYRLPRSDSAEYLPALRYLIEHERVQAILPGTEREVFVLTEAAAQFEQVGCRVIANPFEVVKLCSNKGTLYKWLSANAFGVPRTALPEGWRELAAASGFPLVGKPTTGTGGSRGVALLSDEEEVERYLDALPVHAGVVFQEYIEGPDSEFTVGVLISQTGELIDSIAMQRKLTGMTLGVERTIGGKTYALSTGYSQGFFVRDTLVQSECERLALQIGARGPMNIQCRVSGGRVFVFEVHPRFSGTSSFRADLDFNEPDVLIRNFCHNEQFGRLYYRSNVAAMRAFSNVVVPIEEMGATPEAAALGTGVTQSL